jgi:hypothetical protein
MDEMRKTRGKPSFTIREVTDRIGKVEMSEFYRYLYLPIPVVFPS